MLNWSERLQSWLSDWKCAPSLQRASGQFPGPMLGILPAPGDPGASSVATCTHVHPTPPQQNDNVLHSVSHKVTIFILKTVWSFLLFGNFLYSVLQIALWNDRLENGQRASLIGNLHEDFFLLFFSLFTKELFRKRVEWKIYLYFKYTYKKCVPVDHFRLWFL